MGLISKLMAKTQSKADPPAWHDATHKFAEVYPGAMWVGILLPELAYVLPTVG